MDMNKTRGGYFGGAELERRRKEAVARQAIHNALTPEQKLAKLDRSNFGAKKERARLHKQIADERAAKKK